MNVVRISDARSLGLSFIANEYSSIQAFNQDGSKFLLVHQDHFALYDGDGAFLRDLSIKASDAPRWSRRSPDWLTYFDGTALKALDVRADVGFTVATFEDCTSLGDGGEADTAWQDDARLLCEDGEQVFLFYPDTKARGPGLYLREGTWDSVMSTPDGGTLVSWLRAGTGPRTGIELYDSAMEFQRQVARANGHKAVCRDADGSEVMMWTNSADLAPIGRNAIVKVRLSDGAQTVLLELDWSLAVHVSCPDQAGFAIVSTYQPGPPQDVPYADEILRVALDGSGVTSLGKHGSRPFPDNTYTWQSKASVSRDGRKIVYASNMGQPGADFCDAYLLTLHEHGSGHGT